MGLSLETVLKRFHDDDSLLITSLRVNDYSAGQLCTKCKNEHPFNTIEVVIRFLLYPQQMDAFWFVGHWTETSESRTEETMSLEEDYLEYLWLFQSPGGHKASGHLLLATIEMVTKKRKYSFIMKSSRSQLFAARTALF